MAKTKRTAKPTEEAKEEVNGRSGAASNDERKPNLKTNLKPRGLQKRAPIRDMVISALKAKASADGVILTSIRSYIANNYNNKKKLGKNLQENIKEFIKQEFQKGGIVAVNSKEKEIKFNVMRFSVANK